VTIRNAVSHAITGFRRGAGGRRRGCAGSGRLAALFFGDGGIEMVYRIIAQIARAARRIKLA